MDGRYSNEELSRRMANDDHFIEAKSRIQQCEVLMIDAISMLSKTLFSQIEHVCRTVRSGTRVFGGLQVRVPGITPLESRFDN